MVIKIIIKIIILIKTKKLKMCWSYKKCLISSMPLEL